MQSVTEIALTPAVSRYLDALDDRLNGTALLLATVLDGPTVTPAQVSAAFTDWINSPLFPAMLEEAGHLRGWKRNLAASVRRFHVAPDLAPLTTGEYVERLRWLLMDAPSPYTRNPSPDPSRHILAGFLGDYFGVPLTAEYTTHPATYDFGTFAPPEAMFFDVAPASIERRIGCWFDNLGELGADTVTVWCQADVMGCLLTNGSD